MPAFAAVLLIASTASARAENPSTALQSPLNKTQVLSCEVLGMLRDQMVRTQHDLIQECMDDGRKWKGAAKNLLSSIRRWTDQGNLGLVRLCSIFSQPPSFEID